MRYINAKELRQLVEYNKNIGHLEIASQYEQEEEAYQNELNRD